MNDVLPLSQPKDEDVWLWLQQGGERPATFSALMDLYTSNGEYFYRLALAPLPTRVRPG